MSSTKYNSTAKSVGLAHAGSVIIEQPKKMFVALEVTGTASLIQNNFSQKTVEQMLRKHMGLAVQREAKKPRDCIESATIRNVKGVVCEPPTAFKKGMLTASTQIKGFKKTQLRTQMYVEGNSIPITYEATTPRMDMVRTSGMSRQPDVRFRPSFDGWKARLVIQFSDLLAVQTIVDLLNRAGDVGVGEWRPEKDGSFGTYQVTRNIDDPKEIAEVRAGCSVALVPLVIPEWALDAEISPELLRRIAAGEDEDEQEPEEGERRAAVG